MQRAPVHLIQGKQTSTSTSTQKRSNLEYQYLLGTNSYFDQSQYFRTIFPNLQFCYFKFRQKIFRSVFLPSCLSVDHNLNLNFSLNQRDNILLVTFLNQSPVFYSLTSLSTSHTCTSNCTRFAFCQRTKLSSTKREEVATNSTPSPNSSFIRY